MPGVYAEVGVSPEQVLMATNRPDTLDPALLRPGRLDRKVEFGLPDLESRTQIFQIHTRTMNCERDIRFELLSRCAPILILLFLPVAINSLFASDRHAAISLICSHCGLHVPSRLVLAYGIRSRCCLTRLFRFDYF